MATLLLEIVTEELPHFEVEAGQEKLTTAITSRLEKLGLRKIGLSNEEIKSYSTPKRLAIQMDGLPHNLPAQEIIKRGPPIGRCYSEGGGDQKSPSKMLIGFAQSHQLEPPPFTQLKKLDVSKNPPAGLYLNESGEFIVYYELLSEQFTLDLLAANLEEALEEISFTKMMYWGEQQGPFLRPVTNLLALLDDQIIPFSFKGLNSNRETFGINLFKNENRLSLTHANQYEDNLNKNSVIPNAERRLKIILDQLENIQKEHPDYEPVKANQVARTVNQLVEYPVLKLVDFDPALLTVPQEVTITEMIEHQKYFPVMSKKSGELLPVFIITVNGEFSDYTDIIKGNLKVLSARLRDGIFLYQADLRTGMVSLSKKLGNILFEKTMGSYQKKVERLSILAKRLVKSLPQFEGKFSDEDLAFTASLLKADLASSMVFEFPELQGVIGKYYAEKMDKNDIPASLSLSPATIATTIYEHYLPTGSQGELPTSELGILFSLVEKIDNLMGLFSVGVIPTGSNDPYALRRQTQGMIRIIMENKFDLDWMEFLQQQSDIYQPYLEQSGNRLDVILPKILDFTLQRLTTSFKEMFSSSEIKAVLNREEYLPLKLNIREKQLILTALNNFQKNQDFQILTELLKRISNILEKNKFQKIDSVIFENDRKINDELLEKNSERELFLKYNRVENELMKKSGKVMTVSDYESGFQLFCRYRLPLAVFFDDVFIMSEDARVRQNRLTILVKIRNQILRWFDYKQLSF